MCIICVGIDKERLTGLEARRNFGEMVEQIKKDDPEHLETVVDKIQKKIFEDYLKENGCEVP